MNKLELIDKAVHELKGVLPSTACVKYREIHGYICIKDDRGSFYPSSICSDHEFQQRARELGYVNGYRWGVEYPTNGKKPDLPDDVLVKQYSLADNRWNAGKVSLWNWNAKTIVKFKITDPRYKPADTSYLDSPAVKESLTDDWWDYENNKPAYDGAMPPVGAECEVSYTAKENWLKCIYRGKTRIDTHIVEWIGGGVDSFGGLTRFRPLDWNRKAEQERKRTLRAVRDFWDNNKVIKLDDWFAAAYDAGFLRMPEGK